MALNIAEFQGTKFGNVPVLSGAPVEDYALTSGQTYTCALNTASLYVYADAAHTLTFNTGKTMLVGSGYSWVHGVSKGTTITVSA